MNKNVYILAVAAVTVGLVELIVGGVLPIIADDMQVSTGTAGQLITIFALVYAISGPILLSVTGKYDRKKLFLATLFIFFLGNIATYFNTTFAWRSDRETSGLQLRGPIVLRHRCVTKLLLSICI